MLYSPKNIVSALNTVSKNRLKRTRSPTVQQCPLRTVDFPFVMVTITVTTTAASALRGHDRQRGHDTQRTR